MLREVPYLESYEDEIPDEEWDGFVSRCESAVNKMTDLQYAVFCFWQYDTDFELIILDNISEALSLTEAECLSWIDEYLNAPEHAYFREDYDYLFEELSSAWEGLV